MIVAGQHIARGSTGRRFATPRAELHDRGNGRGRLIATIVGFQKIRTYQWPLALGATCISASRKQTSISWLSVILIALDRAALPGQPGIDRTPPAWSNDSNLATIERPSPVGRSGSFQPFGTPFVRSSRGRKVESLAVMCPQGLGK